MHIFPRKITLLGFISLVAIILFKNFIVINTTKSLTPGIYYRTFATPSRGNIVLVSPPNQVIFQEALKKKILSRGSSDAGTCFMIKIMVADENDIVEVNKHGITVNGYTLPNSMRQDWSIDGTVEIPIKRKLKDEVVLYSPHPLSFDSRYFGPVERSAVIATIKPLFLWR